MRQPVLALLSGLLLTLSPLSSAAGPEQVAKSDRSLWPETLDSPAAYNRASRAEMLVFAAALAEVSGQDEATLRETLRIKSVDRASIERVRDRLADTLLANFKTASADCGSGTPFCETAGSRAALFAAGARLAERIEPRYRPWLDNARQFHRRYAGELVRLAALFPKVSSEIDTFDPLERDGTELPDGRFLLTFDDGPTRSGGHTDALLHVLRQHNLHASFYVLGESLQNRLRQQDAATLRQVFRDQCVTLHGWQHQSHEKWDDWQRSILDSHRLAQETFGAAYRPWFRPPYGQRRRDSAPFFAANKIGVALWNIDSQDWHSRVSADDAAQRVLTLMLLWRKGVILFHDVHPKALSAVPWLLAQTRQSGISWEDCRRY
ncbi:polysaccharide deacetylase family protein [Chitinimonas lacunae]|uniref:Polysaccharide deacetylase family protein n=1 Tax=Chitinimonas lacunae TaxID=1963018 RepID=A0ABV8MUR3_9NEIS